MPSSAAHLVDYKWKPGVSPNPAGRPKGSRSKLQELCLAMLHKDFAEHGEEVIAKVREKHPNTYLSAVVSLLPRKVEKVESPFSDLTDAELDQLEDLLAALRAKTVQQLEGEPQANPQPQPKPDTEAA